MASSCFAAMSRIVPLAGNGRLPSPQFAPFRSSLSSFARDADGNRVRGVVTDTGIVTATTYIGGYYEQSGTASRSYYYLAGKRAAMRDESDQLWFLLGDHLGSTSVAYRDDGSETSFQRYYAWGAVRPGPGNALPTDYTYTGQRVVESAGLLYYGARWYDGSLGRFTQPDTIVPEPGDPQGLNRYSYANNCPTRYTDPTGHWIETALDIAGLVYDIYQIKQGGWTTENTLSLVADVASLALPVVAGGGLAVRAAMHADDVADAARAVGKLDDVVDAVRAADAADDAGDALKAVNAAGDATDALKADVAYRYVGDVEAGAIKKTGVIPNVDARGLSKEVSCTPNFYESAAEAEEGLLMGRLNPTGPTAPPTHRVTFDRNIPHWKYAGNSATGTGIEMITPNEIPILGIDPLGG